MAKKLEITWSGSGSGFDGSDPAPKVKVLWPIPPTDPPEPPEPPEPPSNCIGNLDDLCDVDTPTPLDGDILRYDGTAEKWVNVNTEWLEVTICIGGGHVTRRILAIVEPE